MSVCQLLLSAVLLGSLMPDSVLSVPHNLAQSRFANTRANANGKDTDFDPYLPLYHFVPTPHDWMNDPNGLFYDPVHKKYHLMYQYLTPRTWGHAVSEDLFHWEQLPIALNTDEWYDSGGVYTGSATILNDADQTPVLSYSVSTNDMQAIAFPKNRSDPNLVEWVKYSGNPIINSRNSSAPQGRDDTTAWRSTRQTWLMAYGASVNGHAAAVVFESPDFKTWTQLHNLHYSNISDMWECPDFFPLPNHAAVPEAAVTHLFKGSTAGRDYWVTGTYDAEAVIFTPHDFNRDMGTGNQQYDYGTYYASKSFYDPTKNRQVLFGWVLEERSTSGWQSTQSLPRSIQLSSDGVRIVTPPVEEVLTLRDQASHAKYPAISIPPNSAQNLTQTAGLQVEVVATIAVGAAVKKMREGGESGAVVMDCGLRVLASTLKAGTAGQEYTDVGVVVTINDDKSVAVSTYTDTSSGSLTIQGHRNDGEVVLPETGTEHITLQVFVDGSVVEAYVNGGLAVNTRRVYPSLSNATYVGVFAGKAATQNCVFSNVESFNLVM